MGWTAGAWRPSSPTRAGELLAAATGQPAQRGGAARSGNPAWRRRVRHGAALCRARRGGASCRARRGGALCTLCGLAAEA